MLEELMLKRVLIDGSILSLALGVIAVGSLMYNARLWLNDYPKAIRDKVPPLTSLEKRDRMVVVALVLVAIIGIMAYSALQLRADGGASLTFGQAYLTLFLVVMMFNIFDAVVLDLVLITLFKPKFVILPGMEGMEYLFNDYRKHIGDFLKGIVFCGVFSLPFAIIATL